MKAALEWARKKKTKTRARQTIVPYFFNARASAALEKSALGLYRTVVHHLLSSHDFLRPLFMNKFALKDAGPIGENWTVEELQGFLIDSIESGQPFQLCLFIDALDEAEYESDVRQMINFLIQLTDRALALGESCHLQICLSSRHYPHISIGRGLSLVVEDQPEHGQDIATYIEKQLQCIDSDEKDELSVKILNKSARIFLWVVLVVEMLNHLGDCGAPLSDMYVRLETIPAGLNELFRDILVNSDEGVETSVLFFQWTVFHMRALEPAELFVAMEYSRSPTDPAWATSDRILPPSAERLNRYILNCSRGLVEIVNTAEGQPPVVQFIHETVREFLLKENGLASIVSALATNLIGKSHEILRIACQRCLETTAVPDEYQYYCEASHMKNTSWEIFKSGMRLKLPFLDYAILYLFEHAEEAQKHSVSQHVFLKAQTRGDDLLSNSYRLWSNVLERYKSRKIRSDMSLLYFVIQREYQCLSHELSMMSDISGKFGTVLRLALSVGDLRLVQILLTKGVDVNAQGKGKHNTALFIASQKGYLQIVQLLLEKGADVNVQGGQDSSILYTASEGGHEKVVQLLLDNSAYFEDQIQSSTVEADACIGTGSVQESI